MDDSSVVGVLAEALAQHQLNNWWEVSKPDCKRVSCSCKWVHESDGLFGWESGRDARAIHRAHVASVVAALPNIAVIEVPSVGYKAVGETDAQRYLNIACRIEDGYHVGGSNSRAAVAQLLRRVSDSLAARAAGGQA